MTLGAVLDVVVRHAESLSQGWQMRSSRRRCTAYQSDWTCVVGVMIGDHVVVNGITTLQDNSCSVGIQVSCIKKVLHQFVS